VGRFNPVAVQAASDVAGSVTFCELFEGAVNDLGLAFNDIKFACALRNRS
jgi:hypothetical protein